LPRETDATNAVHLAAQLEQSWGEDLESLGYVLLYFAGGSLPWQGLKAATDKEKNGMIKEKKESLSGEQLCKGLLPDEFATYINYTRSLGFEDKPDYRYLRELFRRVFRSRELRYDNVFDWTEKRFKEIYGDSPAPPTPTESQKWKERTPRTARKGMARGRGRARRIQRGRLQR